MTSPKHSPGPWKMNVARSPASILDANSDCIAKVFLTDAVTKRRDQTHVANANLIVAAPELLAALTELHSAADAYRRSVSRGRATNEAINRMSATLLQAERAIAKAEGRL